MSEPQLTEEEIRRLEAELERISVDDVLLQTIVSLINLGARKAGLAAPPGQAPEPDWKQSKLAIDAVRALMPLLEADHADHLGPVRDAIAQLQLAYAQKAGAGAGPEGQSQAGPQEPPKPPEAPGGGRLWVPGQ